MTLIAKPKEAHQMYGSNLTRAALLLASLSLTASAAMAAPASPFTAMAGTWSGGGVLSTSDGQREQLRCRASYDVAGRGDQLQLNLRCASQSYNFDLASEVEYRGGAISGSWSEASRNASGTLTGRAAGDHVDAAARGDNFSAHLSLTTRGGKQTVSIQPQGTNVTSVSLALSRR
ncbi:hypothetical protein [Bradyrhizobium retamae]